MKHISTVARVAVILVLGSLDASHAVPVELALMQQQYDKLFNSNVKGIYELGVKQLNASYLLAVERSAKEAKASGDLPTALALEAEKKRVTKDSPLLESNESPPIVLQKIRELYRVQLAKLEAQRAGNLKALLTLHVARLKQLESNLTKADRLDDAKAVMDYREGLVALAPNAELSPTKPNGKPLIPAPANTLTGGQPKGGFTNSLGMIFVPVPGTSILMCIHETRRADYTAFIAENPSLGGDGYWKRVTYRGIPVSEADDHPVVMVSWDDAQAFCAWLSKKENRTYRLPTDRDWSYAVGIGPKEKKGSITPERLSGMVADEYPWNGKWPPHKGVGNYADTAGRQKLPSMPIIADYTDDFPTTAPVMQLKPNRLGIFDLGGNVWEWCEDWYSIEKRGRVMRGASWNESGRVQLLSSYRNSMTPDYRQMTDSGFRCVVVIPER